MNSETMLFRQVHPNFIQEGSVSSQAFIPFPKDDGLLSVYHGDLISAADAHTHFTETLKFPSVGVWGVTEFEVRSVNLSARPDPEEFPEHAVIDFTEYSPKECRKLAKKLRDLAIYRGCMHPCESRGLW